MRTYLYKVMYDAGTAPCVQDSLLSLAICKPKVRATAQVGDWLYGFGASSRLGNRLIYIAEVTAVLPKGEYYRRREHRRRPDCIYRWRGASLVQIANDVHDDENVWKDIGQAPDYLGARVLLSTNFRYFGRTDSTLFTAEATRTMAYVAKVGQGHRINLPGEVAAELGALTSSVWSAHPRRMELGPPSDARTRLQQDRLKADNCAPRRKKSRVC